MVQGERTSVLIANRGEIAIRIVRAARELGLRSVSVAPEDDADAPHARSADESRRLPGIGPTAYLDVDALVAVALESGCDVLHPGYGFASEQPRLSRACEAAGIRFAGPDADTLALLGDKLAARAVAATLGIPVLDGTTTGASDDELARFMLDRPGSGVIVKAVAGGGGRGMRVVRSPAELGEALARCRSEAATAFGSSDVYLEEHLGRARHIEVQVVGDGSGDAVHLGERDCSVQRRHQKLVEIAPAPALDPALRDALCDAALRFARHLRFRGVGTFEFLVDVDRPGRYAFIEANPRIQVEHTVTEEITGVDLVAVQLRIAAGADLRSLGLGATGGMPDRGVPARGTAIQARVLTERMGDDGGPQPAGGTVVAWTPPGGPGVRCDAAVAVGTVTNPRYDSLVAKVVAVAPGGGRDAALDRLARALGETDLHGVATNLGVLRELVDLIRAAAPGEVTTTFVDDHVATLVEADRRAATARRPSPATGADRLAGSRVDARDPLAVLDLGRATDAAAAGRGRPGRRGRRGAGADDGMDDAHVVRSPMQGTIVRVIAPPGTVVPAGGAVVLMEAMKMQHDVVVAAAVRIDDVFVQPGDAVLDGAVIATCSPATPDGSAPVQSSTRDPDHVRSDLRDVLDRHLMGRDDARPDAVERRRRTGQRTARENVDDLCDPGTYLEYGPLVVAAQRRRRTLDDLIARTPADGMIAGIGTVNGELFGPEAARCALVSYDYTVLAGTQGLQNHRKKDRLFELAERWRLPVVFFTEGGGGRPGDSDGIGGSGLDCWAFNYFARLSGLVPLVGINSGRCFAGNAAILGCCDVVIATEDSNIGMGGPAMIEGGGLGVFRPEEIGPMDVQVPNGVVDIAVEDEAEAVRVAKQYLSYFQGPLPTWECPDQRLLRDVVPEDRLRAYDIRRAIDLLADTGSVLELRREFGIGMITALARVEGRSLGIVANNPNHLGGAIDSDGADKAARFMQLCDAFDIPLLFLCDTPGMMVGPDVERTALVRHCSRLFVTGANLTVPFFTIVLRKGYGLGAQAMAGGSFKAPFFLVAWPTGEFGGMGLEGAVKLGYRNELAAETDPAARQAMFEQMVARMYEHGKALSSATYFEIDDVIDPAESRRWIGGALRSTPAPERRATKKRPAVDTW